MKTLIEKEIGGDGGTVGLYVEGDKLVQKASYPIEKIVEPIFAQLDPLREKLKAIIPGDWDNPLVDGAFDSVKKEISKLLAE